MNTDNISSFLKEIELYQKNIAVNLKCTWQTYHSKLAQIQLATITDKSLSK